MGLRFGVFDHIEPIPGQDLGSIYKDRLSQIEMFDSHGFYGYHLAEHHSPAVHSPVSYTHLTLPTIYSV